MPSSTSNSNGRIASKPWLTYWVLSLCCVLALLAGWELFWRSKGFKPTISDSPTLWGRTRAQLNGSGGAPSKQQTALIGASRIQQGIHLKTFADRAHLPQPVQLAISGVSPLPVLQQLADDPHFNGRVICDVTPRLLYQQSESGGKDVELWAQRMMGGYAVGRESNQPAYLQMEDQLRTFFQHHFVFASSAASPRRVARDLLKGKAVTPPFWWIDENRMQIADYSAIDIDSFRKTREKLTEESGEPISPEAFKERISTIKTAVDKIHARGGQVILLRLPSSGRLRTIEEERFPRKLYWEPLAQMSGATAIHFEDYPQLNRFDCPDGSHLKGEDAIIFTQELVQLLSSDE